MADRQRERGRLHEMVGRSTLGTGRPGGPRVALWGRFDLPLLGDLLHARIFEAEVLRRLPGIHVCTWSPFGSRRPLAIDGGLASAPLGTWSHALIEGLAATVDCVVIGGGEVGVARDESIASAYGLEPAVAAERGMTKFFLESVGGEPGCVLAWNAVSVPFPFSRRQASRVRRALAAVRYVSVPDRVSKSHLEGAGVETEVALVPDPLLLASRLFTPELLGRRLEYLRRLECFPSESDPILVDMVSVRSGNGHLLEFLAEILGERRVPVVLLETEQPGETRTSEGPGEVSSLPVFRIPAYATLADVVAAVANSACVLTSSRGMAFAASAFGTPCGLLAPSRTETDDVFHEPEYAWLGIESVSSGAPESLHRLLDRGPLPGLPREVEARLEVHFDRLVEIASSAAADRGERKKTTVPDEPDGESRGKSWRQAYEAVTAQTAEQRLRLAERFEEDEAASRRLLETRTRERDEVAAENASRAADVERLRNDLSSTIGVAELLRADLEWTRGDTHGKAETIRALEEHEAETRRLLETRTRERDEAAAESASRLADVEQLRKEVSSTIGVTDLLRADLERARGDTHRKVDIIQALEKDVELLTADRESARGETQRRVDTIQALQKDIQLLKADLDSALGENQRKIDAIQALEKDTQLLKADLDSALSENQRKVDAIQALEKDIQLLKADLDSALGENQRKVDATQALEKDFGRLRADLGSARDELAARTLERDEAVAEAASRSANVERLRTELSSTASVIDFLRADLESARGETERNANIIRALESELAGKRSAKKAAETDAARWRMESDESLRKLTSAQDQILAATRALKETEDKLERAKAGADRLRDG